MYRLRYSIILTIVTLGILGVYMNFTPMEISPQNENVIKLEKSVIVKGQVQALEINAGSVILHYQDGRKQTLNPTYK